jgi:8-oxo-dGTP pyrophosphatase MutT (NUDIX family)
MRRWEGLELTHAPEVPQGVRHAAVAIVAAPSDPRDPAGADLLFIRRAARAGDPWSGDMAFPGGRLEPHDPDLRHTAIRETAEELGLDLSRARCHGALEVLRSPVRAPVNPIAVVPWVFTLDAWPTHFAPNEEVASVHTFALARILSGEGRSTFRWRAHGTELELPCMDLDGQRIWGLTLRMVDDLVARLAR